MTRELTRRPMLCDVLLAVLLTAIDVGWLVAQRAGGTVVAASGSGLVVRPVALLAPGATALVVAQTLPLVARRRAPILVLFVVGSSRVAYDVLRLHDAPQPLGVLVALYTVASLVDGAWRRIVPALTAAGLAVSMTTNPPSDIPVQAALNGLLLVSAWVLADNARTRRAYVGEVEARAAQAELAQEATARQAALEERARIARELHDVVAHHLSVIAVQSQAAAALLPSDPGRAEQALTSVGSTAREALTEMRQLLGVLRRPDADADLGPQPGVADLERLVDPVRDAGLDISLEVVGTSRPLPPMLDLACYRVVQEALTNALKHAGPARVRVRMEWHPDGVALEVSDDGRGSSEVPGSPSQDATSGGGLLSGSLATGDARHGLVGIRERVTLLGGRVWAGARPGEGFAVSAWIPTPTP